MSKYHTKLSIYIYVYNINKPYICKKHKKYEYIISSWSKINKCKFELKINKIDKFER